MEQNCNKPLVSVVVITFNSGKYVLETLVSIKDQTYEKIELIITDDHSKDNTVQICKQWLTKHSNRFVYTRIVETERNSGIAQNCNRGLRVSKGEWIKFIAGDDALEPNIISDYVKYAEHQKDIAAMHSEMQVYNEQFNAENIVRVERYPHLKFKSPSIQAQEQFQILLRDNLVSAPTVMLKKSILEELGGFDEEFPFLEDWPMWLSLTKAGYKMHFVDIVGVKYRMHGHSIQALTNRKIYKSKVEIEVDNMYMKKYIGYLSFLEKFARWVTIYRNLYIRKLYCNRNSKFISFLSKSIGFIPSMILKKYKRKFTY